MSSETENWRLFTDSPGVRQLAMPGFDEAEMEALHSLALEDKPKCSAAGMAALIKKWGCNPRNVFTRAADARWQEEIEVTAPTCLSLDAVHYVTSTSSTAL